MQLDGVDLWRYGLLGETQITASRATVIRETRTPHTITLVISQSVLWSGKVDSRAMTSYES